MGINPVSVNVLTGAVAYNITGSDITDGTVTVADISATGTPSSSTYLRGDGTWASGAGGGSADALGLTATAVKTTNYTAAVGDFVPVDTTSGAVTVTLPTAPTDGSVIAVKHVIRGSTNTVTIARGGSDVFNKASGATSLTLTLVNQAAVLQYKSTGAIWYVVSDDSPLSGTDARYAQVANNLSDVTAATALTNLGAAALASPTFTGTPAAPTAAVDTNTTQLATTAYVIAQASGTTPIIDGSATVGSETKFARGNHIHPTDTTRAHTLDIQSFTSSGTWTKPAGSPQYTEIICIGGGPGGGSGRRGAAGTVRCGGGGGGAGGTGRTVIATASLGSTETVTVGAGGSGGAAVSADDTDGNNGGNGNISSFGTTQWLRSASGGGTGGSGGTATTGAAGSGASGGIANGTAGAAASTSGAVGNNGAAQTTVSNGIWGPTGGGSGGGITSGDSQSNGGAGGGLSYLTNTAGVAGTTGGTTPTGISPSVPQPGGGGGGGSGRTSGAGQAGATGGTYGGGGGGGGASVNGSNSGAGGTGGGGLVYVVTYY